MKKQGYMIAQNGTATAFFTSSSAYDRPIWTSLQEATTYPTAELADKALQKLLKNGAYSARLVEATSMDIELPPDEEQDPNALPPEEAPMDELPPEDELAGEESIEGEDDEDEMVAGQLSDDPLDDLNIEDDDIETGDEFEGDEEELPVREGIDTTVQTIKFNQDTRNERDTNFSKDIEPSYTDIKIPSNVMRAIKSSIDTYNKAAEFNNGRDDAQASMALTIVDALENIKACLDLGTQEGVKQAQIKITTFMNPITSNFPPEVIDFLYKSGRQPISLKTAFYDKWDSKPKEY